MWVLSVLTQQCLSGTILEITWYRFFDLNMIQYKKKKINFHPGDRTKKDKSLFPCSTDLWSTHWCIIERIHVECQSWHYIFTRLVYWSFYTQKMGLLTAHFYMTPIPLCQGHTSHTAAVFTKQKPNAVIIWPNHTQTSRTVYRNP